MTSFSLLLILCCVNPVAADGSKLQRENETREALVCFAWLCGLLTFAILWGWLTTPNLRSNDAKCIRSANKRTKSKTEKTFRSFAEPFFLRDRVVFVARFVGKQRKPAVHRTALRYRRRASRLRCCRLAYKLSYKPRLRKKKTFRPSRQLTRIGISLPVIDLIDTYVPPIPECEHSFASREAIPHRWLADSSLPPRGCGKNTCRIIHFHRCGRQVQSLH